MPRSNSILIITSGALCRNPRPLKEALTLSNAGYSVTVLSIFESNALAKLDAALLADSGIYQETLQVSGSGIRSHSRRLQRYVGARAARYLRWDWVATLGPARELYCRALGLKADLTIVHNEAPLWVGCQLLAVGRKVAADFEDWYSEDLLPGARRYRPIRLLRRTETGMLRRSLYATTTSNALAMALGEAYQARAPHVLTNSFPRQLLTDRSTAGKRVSLFWYSQTIGPGRGIEPFVAAWTRTRVPSTLTLLGQVIPSFRSMLESQMPETRRPDLRFAETVSPMQLPSTIAEHDIGLALEQRTPPSRDLTITNKILQYLNAGLAVLATDTTGQREVAANAAGAVELLPGDTISVSRQLDALLGQSDRIQAMKHSAKQAADRRYCWEREAPILLELVDRALTS